MHTPCWVAEVFSVGRQGRMHTPFDVVLFVVFRVSRHSRMHTHTPVFTFTCLDVSWKISKPHPHICFAKYALRGRFVIDQLGRNHTQRKQKQTPLGTETQTPENK